jgi:hypothetical protein
MYVFQNSSIQHSSQEFVMATLNSTSLLTIIFISDPFIMYIIDNFHS